MWSDPIENTLLNLRQLLVAVQRGHSIDFGAIDQRIEEALAIRQQERRTGKLIEP